MNDYCLLHYEEFGDNDLRVRITPEVMTKYFKSIGYGDGKAMIIVGAIEKLAFTQIKGFGELMEDDARFYTWAKAHFEKKARTSFGYEGYLVASVNSYGEYSETPCERLEEATVVFDQLVKMGCPSAIYAPRERFYGWKQAPVKSYQ